MTPPLIAVALTVALITAVWWSIPVFAPPTLPFGVRVPPDRVDDHAVVTARHGFAGRIFGLAVAGAIAGMVLTLFTSLELALPILTVALLLADTAVYVLTRRWLLAAKHAGDWYAGTRQGVTADLTLRTDPVRIPWRWLLPSLALLAGTAALGASIAAGLPATLPALDGLALAAGDRIPTTVWAAAAPVLTQAGLCLAIAVTAYGLPRTRPQLDAARPAASAHRHRRYLRALTILLFGAAALANLTMLGIALRLWELVPASVGYTVAVFAPLAVLAVATLVFQLRVGQGGHRLPDEPGEPTEDTGVVQRDDDRYWHLGGFVYINPEDPSIFVHQRVNLANWTVNLGRPAGQAIVTALLIAGITVAILAGTGAIDLPEK